MTTTVALTYLAFHAVFLAPPVATLASTAAVRSGGDWRRTLWLGVPLMILLALAYTTPWDNYLIARGVWWYGEGAVATTIWRAPVEEYLFIAVQPVLTALWLAHLDPPGSAADALPLGLSVRDRLLGAAAGAAVGLVGAWLLGADPTFYLGAILLWAAPVLALQWAFGWPYLWRARRTVALAVAVPTAYLCLVDRIALWGDVWIIADRYTTGLTIAGLPVEEATFFLATNLFLVQGLVLLRWVLRRW
jgi:lycopene cyclase domain-containing protein